MASPGPTAASGGRVAVQVVLVTVVLALALGAAWGFPRLDRVINPDAADPGLISFVGTGLAVLILTVVLLVAGLRRYLPKSGLFLAAALGYNALLIAVKLSLSPAFVYASQPYVSTNLNFDLHSPLAYPGLAAIAAIVYGLAFFVLYSIFRSELERRLGISVRVGRRVVSLLLVMFIIAVVGGVTTTGLLAFAEYSLTIALSFTVLAILIALALIGAVVLCSVAFKDATDQAVLLRDVSVLSTFAWVGLAFIAVYHVLWLVFLLTLISLWPLKVVFAPSAK